MEANYSFRRPIYNDWTPDVPAMTVAPTYEGKFEDVTSCVYADYLDVESLNTTNGFKFTCPIDYEEKLRVQVQSCKLLNVEYAYVNYSVDDSGEMFATVYFSKVVEG